MAGLSVAVVIEAREKSGALITADLAVEEGREVFAVPGEITNALSTGTNALLKNGAAVATSAADVLESFGLAPHEPQPELDVFSLVRSGEVVVQPQVADVRATVRYLDDLEHGAAAVRRQLSSFVSAPLRSVRALLDCLLHPRLAAGYGECSALRCLRHAMTVAAVVREMRAHGDDPVRVHAHFAHDPALVGMLVARLTGLPFSFTAHARDLFEIPPESLAARAREATAVVTCCAVNAAYIESVVPGAGRPPVRVIHHGVDLRRFAPAVHPHPRTPSAGRVGRAAGREEGVLRPAPGARAGQAARGAVPGPRLR